MAETTPTPEPGAGAPEAAAPRDPTDGIGRRVAEIRAQRGLGVSELARRVGVSPSLISQIERAQSRPSVSSLFALSRALEVPVDTFFQEGESASAPAAGQGAGAAPRQRYLVHRTERAVADIEGGVRWERLTPETLDEMDFLELVYAPGAESNASLYRHPGDEAVVVLSGRLDIYVGFERFELGPGDSMHFASSQPHRYVNPTDEETRAITVIRHDAGGRG